MEACWLLTPWSRFFQRGARLSLLHHGPQPRSMTSTLSLAFVGCTVFWIVLEGARALLRQLGFVDRYGHFEYGSDDILSMTPKLAKALMGRRVAAAAEQDDATSLIPEVLQDLEEQGGTVTGDSLAAAEEMDKRASALANVGAPPFRRLLKDKGITSLARGTCTTLQLNIGLYCNQACTHCHVESSPLRKEMMSNEVVERCLHLLRESPDVQCLDITGGAPELNNGFKRLVEGAAELRDSGKRPNLRIIDRCNLTVLLEPGQAELANFLARLKVDVIASLPSYDPGQTDRQRGRKVFERSMKGLRILNDLGYGKGGSADLRLDLVFNPPGPFLPPRAEPLELKYRVELKKEHNVVFDKLYSITNMPVKRFFDFLRKQGTLEGYLDLLVRNFNPDTVPNLMCINTVNVGWDGGVFDCDFNQQLELKLGSRPGLTVFDLECLEDNRLKKAPIATGAHCYGCTAAAGSS